jgi:hypothetical protein
MSGLADLIVVALLRTSSQEIKSVCSGAFFNMLSHKKLRLQLLRGMYRIYIYTCINIYTHIYVCIYIYIYMYVVYVRVYNKYIYAYIHL